MYMKSTLPGVVSLFQKLRVVIIDAWRSWKKDRKAARYTRLARTFWNLNLDRVNVHLQEEEDSFKWVQLVNQEVFMWAAIAVPVDEEEFNWLCNRRGFNQDQRNFLTDFLVFAGLKAF